MSLLPWLLPMADDPVPQADDVVAGFWGATVFVALIVAVALLSWSLARQLRKAQTAKDSGVYGEPPADEGSRDN